jgi:hypothetical protein
MVFARNGSGPGQYSEDDMHKVVIAFDVDAPEYAQALAQVEAWLKEHRTGSTLDVWPEKAITVSTIPNLPHQPITVECEKMVIYLNSPKPKKPDTLPTNKNAVLKKFSSIEDGIVVEEFATGSFDSAIDDDISMEED